MSMSSSDDDAREPSEASSASSSPPPPPPPPDPNWPKRGARAWASLANTDPHAVWSFQGWAINNAEKARDMMHGERQQQHHKRSFLSHTHARARAQAMRERERARLTQTGSQLSRCMWCIIILHAGFIGATPSGRFSIIDMASDGRGEWHNLLTNAATGERDEVPFLSSRKSPDPISTEGFLCFPYTIRETV